jgi:hypothetical protein
MISIAVGARFRRADGRPICSINELKIALDRGDVSARFVDAA